MANGATLTITPSKTYDIWCSDTHVKDWYRVRDNSSISRYGEYTNEGSTPDVYATNPGGHALALHFKSFQSTDSGEYGCRLRSSGLPTLSVFLSELKSPCVFIISYKLCEHQYIYIYIYIYIYCNAFVNQNLM